MSDFLDRMRASSLARLERARSETPIDQLPIPSSSVRHVDISAFLVFAEIKPTSPAVGPLSGGRHGRLADAYQSGGAAAISVLTEPSEFGGSLDLLNQVSGMSELPVLRKDFIIDPYQVWEGRAFGADGVLVIARMLDAASLRSVIEAADEAGMFVLLEAFDRSDFEAIEDVLGLGSSVLVGVNSRDLETLQVRLDAHESLAAFLPKGVVAIAESGITSVSQVGALKEMGYSGVLVGTALMRSDDPSGMVRQMVDAARAPAT